METVTNFCKNHPQTTVYIVGKGDTIVNTVPPNMIFTGKVPHSQVKEYIKAADILLMPFVKTELIEYVDPVKMYEYLSFNKHIISTYWDELKQYKTNPLVHFYNDYDHFRKLAEIIPQNSEIIDEQFVKENSWETRMEIYNKIISD